MPQEFVLFETIVAYIWQLCQEKRTGTLSIISGNHLLGQISIKNGEIVFLFSHGKHGLNALPPWLDIKGGIIAFSEGAVPISTPSLLPATNDILEYLASATNLDPVFIRDADPVFIRDAEPLSIRPLSVSTKTVLEKTLREFIGPIASVVCADLLRTITNLDAAIEALADEIPTSAAADQFRKIARQRLSV